MLDFSKVEFSDFEIKSVMTKGADLLVHGLNWKEMPQDITFQEAISYQSFSAENIPISHGCVRCEDPFIEHSCRICAENSKEFKLFSFISAWNGEEIFVVVAKGVAIG